MDFWLYWSYIDTIIILIITVLIILFAWKAYFPRKLLYLVITTFTSLILSIIFLFLAEQQAPYNSNFYLNPILYLIFFGLLGCALFAEYMIAVEMFFKHIRILFIIGVLGLVGMILLYIIGGFTLLSTQFSSYPLIVYIAFESGYYFGIAACLMFGIGSLKIAGSDRLEDKARRNMRIIGILWLFNALYHMWLAWGLLYLDFSVALDLSLSILTLMWVSGESLVYILVVRNLIKYLK